MKNKRNKLRIEIYQDRKKNWRWKMKRCGRIVAEGGEGYKRLVDLEAAMTHLCESLGSGDYEIVNPHHLAKGTSNKCACGQI